MMPTSSTDSECSDCGLIRENDGIPVMSDEYADNTAGFIQIISWTS